MSSKISHRATETQRGREKRRRDRENIYSVVFQWRQLFVFPSLFPSFPLSLFPSFPLSLFPSFPLSLFPSFPLCLCGKVSLFIFDTGFHHTVGQRDEKREVAERRTRFDI